ncbi:hypothetical protein A2715_03680 [Candidatus Woesebacteria bacterium RIFCSPHIGHO2_01_FULL_39_32]|uniref:Antitoxin n=1 Tax=Candidatus Woesebacteria bacterium RIFCSPLOWO2_01_FULL_39_25 TaxID=1802521 RepID=A0A1F8BKS8_9BACT|nr:MAG: hypothetical protein A2124_04985 [Candidatus Woesebacteria bacterium GWB1_37_5]OGM24840.1 MAG: hypothetical protein A2715_03680 [Candidatus Woesebacteria bacterium RIFCSPHIGHO2_01_FULL_39_32]OGM37161.1 MAG: hypothetical protein A3F01_05620 [Candidatus Woesebacteria bacterium RIFCSPHIGHO2_12_FULL_38_11]OGM64666.1 MAG: hypothetical protein A2893_06595 [Candidatus Woesebacteria bacterium RIFCSPLOWO2_01_FULL_39_25]
MAKTLPITKARENLTTLVDRASRLLEEFVITVKGKPEAVLMSHDEFESWKETVDILSDQELVTSIKQGEKDLKDGKYVTFEELKKELKLDV